MQQPREVKCFLSAAILNDLVAEWLYKMGYVRYSEDISSVTIGGGDRDGTRPVLFKIEPKVDVIHHD